MSAIIPLSTISNSKVSCHLLSQQEDYVRYCAAYALEHCADDLAYFENVRTAPLILRQYRLLYLSFDHR